MPSMALAGTANAWSFVGEASVRSFLSVQTEIRLFEFSVEGGLGGGEIRPLEILTDAKLRAEDAGFFARVYDKARDAVVAALPKQHDIDDDGWNAFMGVVRGAVEEAYNGVQRMRFERDVCLQRLAMEAVCAEKARVGACCSSTGCEALALNGLGSCSVAAAGA